MAVFKSKEERIAYVKSMIYMATIDNEITDEEKSYVEEIAYRYGLNEEETNSIWKEIKNGMDIEEVLSQINSRPLKLMLIHELIALCYADNSYSKDENEGIEKICSILNIDSEKVQDIENLIIEQIELQKKIFKVLEMEE